MLTQGLKSTPEGAQQLQAGEISRPTPQPVFCRTITILLWQRNYTFGYCAFRLLRNLFSRKAIQGLANQDLVTVLKLVTLMWLISSIWGNTDIRPTRWASDILKNEHEITKMWAHFFNCVVNISRCLRQAPRMCGVNVNKYLEI
jgi:hypothetical protein